uniref:Uncharacterized protein n=1 Tax=Anguilla anguilla TaxID=7936 RepID=A0A0E9RN37_ANGAN
MSVRPHRGILKAQRSYYVNPARVGLSLPETRMSFLRAQTAYSDLVNSGSLASDFHSPVTGS